MKHFIELTERCPISRMDKDGFEITEYIENKVLINTNDISRIFGSTVVLSTPYRNGNNYCTVVETYEEIKNQIVS